MKTQPLPALTGIRFWLALWVVAYHQMPPVEATLGSFPLLLQGVWNTLVTAQIALGAFFLLSGFVLAYNYDFSDGSRRVSYSEYAIARFSRVYPTYLAGLMFMLALSLLRRSTGIGSQTTTEGWRNLLLNLGLIQAWVPNAALTWNYPGWSLSNEAFFYALFPMLCLLLGRVRRPAALVCGVLVFWGLACAAPLAVLLSPGHPWAHLPASLKGYPDIFGANFIRFNPLLNLPQFCAGILLAKLYRLMRERPEWAVRGGRMAVAAVAGVLIVQWNAAHVPSVVLHNGLLLPLFACLMLGLATGKGFPASTLSSPTMVLLGNASYAMYILHVPIYTALIVVFQRGLHQTPAGWTWFTIYLLAVVACSCVFFKLFEEPWNRKLRNLLRDFVARSRKGVLVY